ncbi:MAG TPA: glucokinase, partial [Thermodesulfobacteriota bacterium]|nr:glucokinase [Thermodesulfobacteriota bacterium]
MPANRKDLILAGDIGGTKTFLGLFTPSGGAPVEVRSEKFVNAGFSGVAEVIEAFIKEGEAGRIGAASLGAACPVEANRCTLTNIHWTVDGEALRKKFRIKRLGLMNDLAAMGWGVGLLSKKDIMTINEGVPKEGNAALIAAGTGLGEAILFWDGKAHTPSSSEGGHTDFGARTTLEVELLGYLMEEFGHVSYERILSGPGIENVYRFLLSREGKSVPGRIEKMFAVEGVDRAVIDEAIKGKDRTCARAIELFLSIYGAEAGNLALKGMAMGGVYVGGGIAPKVFASADAGPFMDAFVDKGRFRDFMSRLPVRLILNDRTALLGAARYGAGLLKGRAAGGG